MVFIYVKKVDMELFLIFYLFLPNKRESNILSTITHGHDDHFHNIYYKRLYIITSMSNKRETRLQD